MKQTAPTTRMKPTAPDNINEFVGNDEADNDELEVTRKLSVYMIFGNQFLRQFANDHCCN